VTRVGKRELNPGQLSAADRKKQALAQSLRELEHNFKNQES
jgi:hypothetical protein